MKDIERKETGLFTSTEELRQLILNNPGLPLLVFAGEDSNNGEYGYMACSSVRASLGEFLNCQQEDFQALLKEKLAEYDPYWKPCIILYVDN